MAFEVYDLVLLVLFVAFVSFFLYTRKHNLKREGIIFLYRTSLGIKLINYVGNKYKKTLKVLSYISITLGYILMASMLYLFGKIVWIYAFSPEIVQAIKIPPVLPLIPYLPQIFNISFLPPFYFTYWIIVLAVIAITHEFAHGIFAVYNKVKVKTTGFGFFPYFLPVFLAAFVELDEKKMAKKKISSQLSILAAGTFANILTAIFFFLVLCGFFLIAFAPSGVVFNSYSYSAVGISSISMVNGIAVNSTNYSNLVALINNSNSTYLNKIEAGNASYLITKQSLESQKGNGNQGYLIAYDNAPAIKAQLDAIILEVNGQKVTSLDKFRGELSKYSPGENISLKTKGNTTKEQLITLGENPENKSLPFLGIGFASQNSDSFSGKIITFLSSFKKPSTYYEPQFAGVNFIYNLLWWLILISLSVALVNMLPMGIFDGGRFFYLTVLAITKSPEKSKKIFSFMSYLLLFLLFMLVVFWIFSFF